jgi:hypothetical protein
MHVPGVPKHHNVCSRCCRFTESYNSQCVSHFAERFIGPRTNTSIATYISESHFGMHVTTSQTMFLLDNGFECPPGVHRMPLRALNGHITDNPMIERKCARNTCDITVSEWKGRLLWYRNINEVPPRDRVTAFTEASPGGCSTISSRDDSK